MQQKLNFTGVVAATGEEITHSETIELEDPRNLDLAMKRLLVQIGQIGMVKQDGHKIVFYPAATLKTITCESASITIANGSDVNRLVRS